MGPAASQSLTNHPLPLPAVSASRIDDGRSIGCERGFNNRSLQECEFVRIRRVIASNRPKYSDGDIDLAPTGSRALASGSLSEERGRDATDRPDVTKSSVVAPYGSLQAENGSDSTVKHGSNLLNGTNTRVRPGIARCTESLIDLPSYLPSLNRSQLAVDAAASGPGQP